MTAYKNWMQWQFTKIECNYSQWCNDRLQRFNAAIKVYNDKIYIRGGMDPVLRTRQDPSTQHFSVGYLTGIRRRINDKQ